MIRRFMYLATGMALGVFFSFFCSDLMAQYESPFNRGGFEEMPMDSSVPAAYGDLVQVSVPLFYFRASDGTIYVLRQRSDAKWDPTVRVIKRS